MGGCEGNLFFDSSLHYSMFALARFRVSQLLTRWHVKGSKKVWIGEAFGESKKQGMMGS